MQIIRKEDITYKSDASLYFDTTNLINIMQELTTKRKSTVISVIYKGTYMLANMCDVCITESGYETHPVKLTLHAYNPPVSVYIGIEDAENYSFLIDDTKIYLKDYIKKFYEFKFYNENGHNSILNVGDVVQLTAKDDDITIEKALGIVSNTGYKLCITIADPKLIKAHNGRGYNDVTKRITFTADNLNSASMKEFEIIKLIDNKEVTFYEENI